MVSLAHVESLSHSITNLDAPAIPKAIGVVNGKGLARGGFSPESGYAGLGRLLSASLGDCLAGCYSRHKVSSTSRSKSPKFLHTLRQAKSKVAVRV